MISQYFKVSGTDESVLDPDEILKFELKNEQDDEFMESLYRRQHQQSEKFKPLLSLYIQDAVQKGESRGYTRLKNMVRSDTWNRQIVRSIFS